MGFGSKVIILVLIWKLQLEKLEAEASRRKKNTF